ncbi:DUF975 family protein [Tetragenococcus koreensis]|uniref:Molybdenum ABC transporter substrate-binding protein n=1 Tax=Tetragenococcus koreensis TaxID=290335 RepID=A0AAN4RLT7_9ENTE|nr:DUF975 family protein [Tetragenococcus koreensis]AYW46162.1 molybdenum ABC transporter substrate-binding protein [Tetragenococcus koreensis]MCF1586065.1 DUF975 family protein [Tetragenococcus koreensis]MCF1615664.1 DUF975 family protein [Tetragenococcus koreensis]MCF1617634.1 DUF975 family protein [Tetragenococcus koreensis]MCF1620333.1 DUF975 family protein [Tetragenococcus koreensis]
MKSNAEIRAEARKMLKGRWKESVLMNLVPVLITIVIAAIILIPAILFLGQNVQIMNDSGTYYTNYSTGSNGSTGGSSGFISGLITTFFTVAISWTFLDVLRGKKIVIQPFKDVFRTFRAPYALAVLVIYLLTAIFQFLWSLLLVIPGVIKGYSYSQSYYIYYDTYEETGQTPRYLDSITASRHLMDGFKAKLFFLDLSFIGWHILCLLTFGIGYLWLMPYIYATKAAFYNNLPKE